jgi:AraC-like DNA-binding protein/mannose-6-phosphate isomerase-like protein (cupin superfamily)
MNSPRLLHENKKHGKDNFAYSIYHSIIPYFIRSFPFHWHDEIEITYIKSGIALFTICSRKIAAGAGDILITNGKYPHSVEQYGESEAEFFSILFHPEILSNPVLEPENQEKIRDISSGTVIFPETAGKGTPLNRKLSPYLEELIENRHQSYADFQLGVMGCLFMIFQILSQNAIKAGKTADEFRMEFSKIKPAVNAVINHYEHRISVADAARECCLSESHFMMLFKRITGKSFNMFLIEHRLDMSSKMLRDTEEKIIDIASSCGFDNQSYFTRMFQRYYAMTPGEYRKLNRQK